MAVEFVVVAGADDGAVGWVGGASSAVFVEVVGVQPSGVATSGELAAMVGAFEQYAALGWGEEPLVVSQPEGFAVVVDQQLGRPFAEEFGEFGVAEVRAGGG